MKNKKLNLAIVGFVGLAIFFTSCEKQSLQDEFNASAKKAVTLLEDCTNSVPLVAGREKELVGSVDIEVVKGETSSTVFVTFNVDEGWYITQTQVHLFTDNSGFTDIPMTKNFSPKIGNFADKMEHPYVTSYTYEIENYVSVFDHLYVAAHADVEPGISGIGSINSLPEVVTLTTSMPGGFIEGVPTTYFDITIEGENSLSGKTYGGFCVDVDRVIDNNKPYIATAYSSYGDFPDGLDVVNFPENLDLVNWIINQNFTNIVSDCAGRNYTYGDIQYAIWSLLDDNLVTNGLGEYSVCAAQEIIDAAKDETTGGEGFVPGCGEYIGIILVPGDWQRLIIWVKVPCYEGETAWGFGDEFTPDGRDWSMYFKACE